jgi:hypothetical protein
VNKGNSFSSWSLHCSTRRQEQNKCQIIYSQKLKCYSKKHSREQANHVKGLNTGLKTVIREDLAEKAKYEQRPEGGEGK